MKFHTNLPVRDIEATTRFYSALFGVDPVKKKKDYVKFLPQDVALNLSFHQSNVIAANKPHLGFEMADQASLDRAYQRLLGEGLVEKQRETSVCCYANQDKFWVSDPDGYEWEFYVLVEDTERKIGEETSCCVGASSAAPCC